MNHRLNNREYFVESIAQSLYQSGYGFYSRSIQEQVANELEDRLDEGWWDNAKNVGKQALVGQALSANVGQGMQTPPPTNRPLTSSPPIEVPQEKNKELDTWQILGEKPSSNKVVISEKFMQGGNPSHFKTDKAQMRTQQFMDFMEQTQKRIGVSLNSYHYQYNGPEFFFLIKEEEKDTQEPYGYRSQIYTFTTIYQCYEFRGDMKAFEQDIRRLSSPNNKPHSFDRSVRISTPHKKSIQTNDIVNALNKLKSSVARDSIVNYLNNKNQDEWTKEELAKMYKSVKNMGKEDDYKAHAEGFNEVAQVLFQLQNN